MYMSTSTVVLRDLSYSFLSAISIVVLSFVLIDLSGITIDLILLLTTSTF